MTTDLSTAKRIEFDRITHDFNAYFDDQYIGSFATKHDAENELNQYVLLLCEQGLLDRPLGALAEQALIAANPPEPAPPVDDDIEDNFGGWRSPIRALTGALATFRAIPAPLHDGEYLEQLADEARATAALVNVLLHRAVRLRADARSQAEMWQSTPEEALCNRLYRLHGKACGRSIRRTQRHTDWLREHTCSGIEHHCGASALNAYATVTGSDMETARGVTLYYCDKHFQELTELTALVEA